MVESQDVTLTYWNGRGRCEGIRIMLAACGVKYSDNVPGFEDSHINKKEHIESMRSNGHLLMNQVPLL